MGRTFISIHRFDPISRAVGTAVVVLNAVLWLGFMSYTYCASWQGTLLAHWVESDSESTAHRYKVQTSAGVELDPPGFFPWSTCKEGLPLEKPVLSLWVKRADDELAGDAAKSFALMAMLVWGGFACGRSILRSLAEAVTIDAARGVLVHEPYHLTYALAGVWAEVVETQDSEGSSYRVKLCVPGRSPIVVKLFARAESAQALLAQLQPLLPKRAVTERAAPVRAPAGGAPVPVVVRRGAHCRVCGTEFHRPAVACPACETPHHGDCWEFAGGCAVYACRGGR